MVLQSTEQSISLTMQHFNSILAKKINKVLNRDGTVFSSRFRSIIVEDERLKELIRAVHLEGVQLGEMGMDELNYYKFCSHSVIMGHSTSELIDKDVVLKKMNIDSKEAYLQFLKDIDDCDDITSKIKDINRGRQGFQKPQLWVIGKEEFVEHVMEVDRCRRSHVARHISENVKMEEIHGKVTRFLIMENEDLYRTGQSDVRSTGRELFVFICKRRYEFSGADLARYLRVTEAAVSRMLTRFRNVENKEYLIEKVLKEMT